MFRRFLCGIAAVSLVACAGSKAESGGAPTQAKQKLVNVTPFDVGNCFARTRELPKVASQAELTGIWVALQPALIECLVDPANRGPSKDTLVDVKITVDSTGLKHDSTTSTNLSPAGTTCVDSVLEGGFSRIPALGAKDKPVAIEQKLEHQVGRDPSVQMGLNEISDVAGTIRLALPKLCACYAPWQEAAPHSLKLALTLHKAGGAANDLKLVPTGDAVTDGVGACVQAKLAALTLPVKSDTLSIPGLPLLFLNTSIDKDLSADQAGPLRIAQLDGLRGQRNADSAILAGSAAIASQAYAAAVNKYKANSKSVSVEELKNKCKALLNADDGYIKSLGAQVDIDQRTLALATSLKAEDASWADLEAGAQKQVAASQAEVTKAKTIRQRDSDACPKVHY